MTDMSYGNPVTIDDLSNTTRTDARLPVYRYDEVNQYVYPLEVSDYVISRIERYLDNGSGRPYSVEIPLDEDIARYWAGQLVYIVSYDHGTTLSDIFSVKQVDIGYDYDYNDLESYVVMISPLLHK